MEKISGIIPASPRTSVVDNSPAQPARPGAPILGRPVGKNSLGDRITLSKAAAELRAAAATETGPEEAAPAAGSKLGAPAPTTAPAAAPASASAAATYKGPSEASKVKVVESLNKKFFERPIEIDREGGATSASEEALNRYNQVKNLRPDLEAQ